MAASPTAAIDSGRRIRDVLLALYVLTGLIYLAWRPAVFNGDAPVFSTVFYASEVLIFLAALLRLWVMRNADMTPPSPPPPPDVWPSIDVFVTTLREPASMVRRTLRAAVALDGAHRTWLLDDGNRAEMAELARELGAGYIARQADTGAKAGNLNNALARTDGEFFAVFDADHIAEPRFLARLMGWFADEAVALVQTPQDYFNTDSFQHGRGARSRDLWHEQSVFHWNEQPGRDRLGATTCCGCSMIARRSAIEAIGGFPEATVTEDMHAALRLHKAGWKTLYHAEPLAYGVAPAGIRDFLRQRLRWGEGNMQVCRIEGVPFAPKLGRDRNLAYLMLGTTYLEAWNKLILYVSPLIFLVTLTPPIWSDAGLFAAIFLPYLLTGFLASVEFGRGYAPFLQTERFAMARLGAGLLATAGLFRRRIPFRVTDKRLDRGGLGWLAPQVLILLGAVAGLTVATVRWFDLDTIPPPLGIMAMIAALAVYNAALAAWVIHNALRSGRSGDEAWACPEPLPVRVEGQTGLAVTRWISSQRIEFRDTQPAIESRLQLLLPDGGLPARLARRPDGGLVPVFDSPKDRDRLDAALYGGRWRRILAGKQERRATWLELVGILPRPAVAGRWTPAVWRCEGGLDRLAAVRGDRAILFDPGALRRPGLTLESADGQRRVIQGDAAPVIRPADWPALEALGAACVQIGGLDD